MIDVSSLHWFEEILKINELLTKAISSRWRMGHSTTIIKSLYERKLFSYKISNYFTDPNYEIFLKSIQHECCFHCTEEHHGQWQVVEFTMFVFLCLLLHPRRNLCVWKFKSKNLFCFLFSNFFFHFFVCRMCTIYSESLPYRLLALRPFSLLQEQINKCTCGQALWYCVT